MHFLNKNKQIAISLVSFFLLCIIYFNSKEVMVIIGETRSLITKNPKEVKIGNPNILDVVGAGRNELLLSGLAVGETKLIVVYDFCRRTYTVKGFQEDLEKLKERIDVLLEAAGFQE